VARRPYVAPAEIVRPPLTKNDALRASGMLPHAFGRPDFLRKTVDVIDRAHPDAEERLRRFVQDWQHHAKAGMLVELGDTLAYLVEGIGHDPEEQTVGEAKIAIVDDILAKVPGLDDVEDIKADHLVDAFSLLDALAEEYGVRTGWQGYPELREKLIENRVKADDATDTVDALRAEVAALKKEMAEQDEIHATQRAVAQANAAEAVRIAAENKALRNAESDLRQELRTIGGIVARLLETP